ncbi:hypothetical protein VNO77_19847 [Canavalia gladiata]|uniref:Uncharacterized protein n=1 Tax=Canavalia gladiata TaxID=3824 RepID=A0AAN9LNG3_CANGL
MPEQGYATGTRGSSVVLSRYASEERMIGDPGTTSRQSQFCLAVTVTSSKAWIEASIVGIDISGGSVAEGQAESNGGFSLSSVPCSPWAQVAGAEDGEAKPIGELVVKTGCDQHELTKPVSRAVGEGSGSVTSVVKGEAKTAHTSNGLQAKLKTSDSYGGVQGGPVGKNPFLLIYLNS